MRRDQPRPLAVPALIRGEMAQQQVRGGISLRMAQDEQVIDLSEIDYAGNAGSVIRVNASADGLEPAGASALIDWGDIGGTLSNQTDLQAALDAKLPSATYTAADVLTKLLTVDGTGSGLDADLLDGQSSAFFLARANHTGTQDWSTLTGTPTTLAGYGIVLTSGNVTTALGFTPYDASNPSGYISSITSGMVTTALGYTPTSVVGLTGSQSVAAFKTGLSLVKADVGLGSVDNTSDASKPISTATQGALDLKAAIADMQVFTANGTWTKPAGAKVVHVICISGGGGGASGRKGAAGTVRCGGGGGAGGQVLAWDIPASLLSATETITVGAGGTGGAAQATNSTNGVNGGLGAASSFGTRFTSLVAVGGFGGSATNGIGGPASALNMNPPGSGASADTSGGGAGTNGVRSPWISGSGGGAGGGVTSGNVASVGGAGGGDPVVISGVTSLGGGGAAGAVGLPGGTVAARTAGDPRGGAGGGGGGGSTGGNGGAGAVGQFPGGGGGGGGAAVDAVGNSGAGGDGAAGCVIVWTYF